MNRFGVGLLVTLATASAPSPAEGASVRGQFLNNLQVISLALKNCEVNERAAPTDICDSRGRPLLSWRVRLLRYVEDEDLFNLFHLDEPWDSPHNRTLLGQMPKIYWDPDGDLRDGRTCFLAVRAAGALGCDFVPLVVAEADADHAVPWTKPGDLPYDPAHPARGLARRFGAGAFHARGAFVAFADGSIRLVPGDADAGQLRTLFAGDGGPSQFSLAWYAALRLRPVGLLIGPWLVLTLAVVAGAAAVGWRLRRGLPVSPGEMLWLVAGAAALTHAAAVAVWYRYEPFPYPYGGGNNHGWLWFLPALALTVSAFAAAVHFGDSRLWRGYFLGACVLFGLVALGAMSPHQHQAAEESFATAVSPINLALVAAVGAGLALRTGDPGSPGRRLAHWTGLLVCLLPFAWLLFCHWWGVAEPRGLFVRVLD